MRNELSWNAEAPFADSAWQNVLQAVDRTYAELVDHQQQLEAQNEELHEFRRFLSSILTSVRDVMIVISRDGAIEEVSQSVEKVTGRERSGFAGKAAAELFSAEDAPAVVRAVEALRFGADPIQFEANLLAARGTEPFDLTFSARVDDRGRMIGAIIVGRPLGELRQAYAKLAEQHESLKDAQTQLVRNEKLASLGRLLAGVAHELNNPISFVYANTHALERYVGRFEEYFARVEAGASREELISLRQSLKLDREIVNLRSAIDGARDGAERVRDIVADLRRLSVAGSASKEPFDLVEAACTAARWVRRGSKSKVEPHLSGAKSLRIVGNPGHVQQIVMNLVQNAIDALKDTEAPELTINIAREGAMAVATVADNGPGVDPDDVTAIFDPFYTSKAVGEGTGLGLSISQKIASEHGGSLSFVPCDRGAVFRLALPIGEPG